MIVIQTSQLGKRYGNNRLFKNMDFRFEQAGAYAVTGINGSGKSTFLMCLSRFITPTEGKVEWKKDNQLIEDPQSLFSICSPSLNLFEELSLQEIFDHHSRFSKSFQKQEALNHLEEFGLHKSLNKTVASFSSGMKQRVKLLLSIFNDVPVIFLDEPCSNLDENGIKLYQQYIKPLAKNKLIIIATNHEASEFPFIGPSILISNN